MNEKLKARANKTIKYINYLQKKGIKCLQDKEGNVIDITSATNEMVKAWQTRPVEIKIKGKTGIYYNGKNYLLDKEN